VFLSMDHRDGELLESLDRTVNLGNLLILSDPSSAIALFITFQFPGTSEQLCEERVSVRESAERGVRRE